MLPNATCDQIIATGFNRNSMINEEGGIDPLEYRFYSMVDRVQVASTAWLGLTMACAQCHTHKYDPIQHTEYYRFIACLNNASEPTMEVSDAVLAGKCKIIQKQIDALEATLPDKFPVEARIGWQTPGAAEFASQNGTQAEFLSDGSFLTGVKYPDKDTYTINFEVGTQRLTHVQVEAIPDEQIRNGGPGRSDSGNFVLSELEMDVRKATATGPRRLKFASVEADYHQEGFPAANAIDGKDDSGWAIGGSGGGPKHRHAIFALTEPLELTNPAVVTIRLVQHFGGAHTLGRFRVSFGQELADKSLTEQRRRELPDKRCVSWLADRLPTVVTWKPLRPMAATSTAPILTIEDDDSVFASGDSTKSDS
jgi:hypothetical protein